MLTTLINGLVYLVYPLSIFLAYLIGSIPFSYIVAKVLKGVDIRKVGSGNVGATNVYRNCGKASGLLAFILDSGKAGLTFYIAMYLFPFHFALILGVTVVIGHCYSIFLKFKGGKGVASAAGLFFFLDPFLFSALLLVFLIIVFLTSYVSLASMLTALLAPLSYFVIHRNYKVSLILFFLVLFIIYRHKANIVRLIQGEENKINLKKNKNQE